MVFYLKINRRETYTKHNLQRWIDAISLMDDSRVFILCDNDDLQDEILSRVKLNVDYEFIKSENGGALGRFVEKTMEPHWYGAAYAHGTTFQHAARNGYEQFWNIDADDTFFALSPSRLSELLMKVQNYATDKAISLFSLDMWYSRSRGNHWSFGITYTDDRIDWMRTMLNEDNIRGFIESKPGLRNIDAYFSYLRNKKAAKIETFCFENLRFVHYSNDLLRRGFTSGIFHWKEGRLRFPIAEHWFGLEDLGGDIAKDVIRLSIGITDEESQDAMIAACYEYDRDQLMNFMRC